MPTCDIAIIIVCAGRHGTTERRAGAPGMNTKYEYVYGSFKECSDMLVNGDIDLFGNVSYKPERAELFDFSSYPPLLQMKYWILPTDFLSIVI